MSSGQQVSLDQLSVQQLTSVKKQLDEEVNHLTNSFAQLQAAQIKFRDCLRTVKAATFASPPDEKQDILVPLTNSLYVRGKLAQPDRVMVDVGTGFFIDKNASSAAEFYNDKVKELGGNVQQLEAIVQQKTDSLRVVEEVLRHKMAANASPT